VARRLPMWLQAFAAGISRNVRRGPDLPPMDVRTSPERGSRSRVRILLAPPTLLSQRILRPVGGAQISSNGEILRPRLWTAPTV
jgi:hypothetical protein